MKLQKRDMNNSLEKGKKIIKEKIPLIPKNPGVYKMNDVIKYLNTQNFKIRKSGTVIELGNSFTIQRKGGDSGRKSSNQLQFKIIISSLNELSEFEYLL